MENIILEINNKKNVSDNLLIKNSQSPARNSNIKEGGFVDLDDLAYSIKRKSINFDPSVSIKKKQRTSSLDLKGNGNYNILYIIYYILYILYLIFYILYHFFML